VLRIDLLNVVRPRSALSGRIIPRDWLDGGTLARANGWDCHDISVIPLR